VSLRILEEAAPGLAQIKLPLPFELREVNVYLLRTPGNGYTLIDTGYHAEDCFQTLEASLQHLRVQWTDIRQVVLTHMHPDHMGNAHRILKLTQGATLVMHAREEAHLRQIADAGRPPWFEAMLRLAGTPVELEQEVYAAFTHIRDHTRALNPQTVWHDGEMLEDRFEVVHTPGHSPGHVCLFDQPAGLLLSGDHMLPGITPNIGWLPGEDTLGDYLDSLGKVAPFVVETVMPAHGKPFVEHRGWLEETARHHEERCAEVRGILAERPAPAHDIVGRIWTRKLAPFHYQFAVSEILAHLEYMSRRGEVRLAGATDWQIAD
jgi:glyoxylase-like metal-dependent hydrolase (beta-lactamase superfamily II)